MGSRAALRGAPLQAAGAWQPRRKPGQQRRPVCQADGGGGGKDFGDNVPDVPKRRRRRKPVQPEPQPFTIESINPVSMGRKSREVFDDVWTQLQRIGNPTRSTDIPDSISRLVGDGSEFESPDAASTTVLVTGATGRVGRVLVRKLLLRGYKVRALIRQRETGAGTSSSTAAGGEEAIPQAVEQVVGDLGDYSACRAAVKGVDKIICASGARSTVTVDLARVDEAGVANLARAFQDELNARARKEGRIAPAAKRDIADFAYEDVQEAWDITAVGLPQKEEEGTEEGEERSKLLKARRRQAAKRATARDTAECYIDEGDNLVFEGAVYSRGGLAEAGAALDADLSGRLNGSEGLVVRAKADEHAYSCVVRTGGGHTYTTRFSTRPGFNTLRLPFNQFRPALESGAPPLAPADISYVGFRFEPRSKALDTVTEAGQGSFDLSANRFKLEVDWVKALPGGTETDFVLVSCAGKARMDLDEQQREKVIAAKRKGEAALRNSGLGYTVVRPGPLVEEAGGYKALVFDQGNRIEEAISCADVAHVCLRALHNPEARNKTFEVCFEYQPEEGLEFYELISHLPDKSNSYLTPALAPLTKNT